MIFKAASGLVCRYLQGAKQVLRRKWSSAGVWRDRPDGEKDPASNGWLSLPVETRHMPVLDEDLGHLPHPDPVSRQLYIDFHATTLPTILRNFDRMSMAHGVEIRTPFMDYRLATFSHALPLNEKLDAHHTKAILRKAMHGLMPESIRQRRDKLGFVFPLVDWAKEHMQDRIMDHMLSSGFRTSPVWNATRLIADVETAFRQNDMARVRQAWPFIQAAILTNRFSAQAKSG